MVIPQTIIALQDVLADRHYLRTLPGVERVCIFYWKDSMECNLLASQKFPPSVSFCDVCIAGLDFLTSVRRNYRAFKFYAEYPAWLPTTLSRTIVTHSIVFPFVRDRRGKTHPTREMF